MRPAALDRCGRLGDGWIPSLCTPEEAAEGKRVIDEVAAAHGRAISPEHFGISVAYAPAGTDYDSEAVSALARRAKGRPLDQLLPVGLESSAGTARILPRCRLLQVHRPAPWRPPVHGGRELEALAAGVGDLQT